MTVDAWLQVKSLETGLSCCNNLVELEQWLNSNAVWKFSRGAAVEDVAGSVGVRDRSS